MFAVVMGAFLVPSRLSAVPISAHRHNGLRPMTAPPPRLAELIGGLTLASDFATAFPPEKVLRTAVLVVELGRRAGLRDAELRDAYYVTVLRFLGCTGFAHEEAHVYGAGDDLGTRNVMSMADAATPVGTLRAITAGLRGAASAD